MRVNLDVQSAIGKRAGVGRYTAHLAQQLPAAMPDSRIRLTCFDFRRQGPPLDVHNVEWRLIRACPGRLAQMGWKQLGWPAYDRFSGPADLFHFPNFIIPPLRRGKAVVTIHDMAFKRYPETIEEGNLAYLNAHIGRTVQRADAILTISAASASEISDLLKVDPQRITAIHLGIADSFHPIPADACKPVLDALGIDRPYLLCVGTLEPRKNIPFLVAVFERLERFDGLLVLAGEDGWKTAAILDRIARSPRARDIHRVHYVPDGQLPALYNGASLLLQPSFYEGFGFPPLEAMACGIPVLSSAGGSLAEVLGDAAEVLDSFDTEGWAARAESLLTDTDLRRDRVARGRRHAANFTWQRTARETAALYREVF